MKHQPDHIRSACRSSETPVIVYQWRGRLCMRARPGVVSNPRTPLQQAGRSRFGLASRLAARLAPTLVLGLRARARALGMTERNLFLRLNRDSISFADGVLEADLPRLVVSQGPVAPVSFGKVQWTSATRVSVVFSSAHASGPASSTDRVQLMAFCPARGESLLAPAVGRTACRLTMDLPAAWVGEEVHFYGFVTDADGQASPSTHLTLSDDFFYTKSRFLVFPPADIFLKIPTSYLLHNQYKRCVCIWSGWP